MLINYIKITLRNLMKNRVQSGINILGLSVGIGVSLLMLLFAWNVLTYDQFHENSDDLYFLYRTRPAPEGGTLTVYDTWVPAVPEMMKDFPEIVNGYRSFSVGEWVQFGEKRFREEIDFAEPGFFEMFSFPLVKGDPQSALSEKSSIILSQEMAEKYFGSDDPIGKTLQVGESNNYTVTGVLGKIPVNSTFSYDMIAPWENAMDIEFVRNSEWRGSFLFSFVQLRPGTDPAALEAKFPAFVDKFFAKDAIEQVTFKLMPLKNVHNAFTGMDRYAFILIAIALAILALACINYTNLSIARSLQRAREIGMRKVLGANRGRLFSQFMIETFLIVGVTLLLGIGLAELLLPKFNEIVQMELALSFSEQPALLIGLLIVGAVTAFFSGIYPAMFLSRFRPISVLKATHFSGGDAQKKPGGLNLRNALVITQFVVSIGLIIATGVVLRQIDFMKSHDLQFDKENMIVLRTNPRVFTSQDEALATFATLKKEITANSTVKSVAQSRAVPGIGYGNSYTLARPEGWDTSRQLDWRFVNIDAAFLPTYGIELTQGRNFSGELATDEDESIIINEAAAMAIGWDNPVGKMLYFGENTCTIIGVVKDYNYEALREPVQPVIHFYNGLESTRYFFMSVKFANDTPQENIALLEQQWGKIVPGIELTYFVISDRFRQLYQVEDNLAEIISYSSALAILVACLGLFGLTAFSTAQRTKEIGIRKVLGASVSQVLALIGKDFMKLVLLANLVAWPLGWYAMNQWLQNYPYRMSMGWSALDIFLFATLTAVAVSMLTIGYQTIRAARANPVKSLRYE